MTPLLPEPAAREEKPGFDALPQAMRGKISDLLRSPVIAGEIAYGGLSASAGFILTLQDGRKVFAKGNHPGEMAHGTENLRQEIRVFESIPALKTAAPRYLGLLDDGDEDGWMLGLWEYIESLTPPAPQQSVQDMIGAMKAWQTGEIPASILPAIERHNYLKLFFDGEKKWRRIAEEPPTREKFLTLFADKDAAEKWALDNAPSLGDLQRNLGALQSPRGLVHGDLRLDNFLFGADPAGRTYTIDWPNACEGPLVFDALFLASNLAGLGVMPMEKFLRSYTVKTGIDFSAFDIVPVLAAMSGFFADQAYRAPPPKLPRLRWMQKIMLRAQLEMLAHLGAVDSIPAGAGG